MLRNHVLWLTDSTKGQRLIVEGSMLADQVFQNQNFKLAVFRPNAVLKNTVFHGCHFASVTWQSTAFVDAYFKECSIRVLGNMGWRLDTDAPDVPSLTPPIWRSGLTLNMDDYQELLEKKWA